MRHAVANCSFRTDSSVVWRLIPWAVLAASVVSSDYTVAQAPAPVAPPAVPGQNAANALPMIPLVPAARASRLPSLNDLTQVKLDLHHGELQLVMMLEGYRTEKRTGRVIRTRAEQRTRTIRDANGEEKQQTYTVQVPFAEEGEVDVKIPAGRKPFSKPASEFQFFDLKGNALTIETAAEKLKTLQPAFLLDRFAGTLPEIPELHRQALNDNCLIIITEGAVRDLGNQALPGEVLPARLFEIEQRIREFK